MSTGDKHIVTPYELRVIAGNGYGRHLNLWGDIMPNERESKFYQLTITNDTDWVLCPSCYQETREYAVDQSGGLSHEDFRELLMKSLWKQSGVVPPSGFSKDGMTTIQAPPPRLIDNWPQRAPVTEVRHRHEVHSSLETRAKRRPAQLVLIAIVAIAIGALALWWRYSAAQRQVTYQEAQTSFDQGLGYAKTERPAEAAAMFERAISLRADFAEAYAQLGLAYQKLARTEEAIKAAKRAVELKPSEAWAQRNLGEIYRRNGRWNEAIDAYKQAITV
ncbi:MAG: tetratricopeptide repeat protein, partial [Acidobacteria bacterium]|nr:tetratricopeptide repeat protein [Acidobacteriota bacterium]